MGMHKLIARIEPRQADHRSEPRHGGIVERAAIHFRGRDYDVPVVNISSRGTMIECEVTPHIGETVMIQFDRCSRIRAFVRWVRDGRIGLNFGQEILLG